MGAQLVLHRKDHLIVIAFDFTIHERWSVKHAIASARRSPASRAVLLVFRNPVSEPRQPAFAGLYRSGICCLSLETCVALPAEQCCQLLATWWFGDKRNLK